MSLTPEEWRVTAWTFFVLRGYDASTDSCIPDVDLTNPADAATVASLFDPIINLEPEIVSQALNGICDIVTFLNFSLDLYHPTRDQLVAKLIEDIKASMATLGYPLIANDLTQVVQPARVLRTVDGEQKALPMNVGFFANYNDVKLSADGTMMAAAGSGTRTRPNTGLRDSNLTRFVCKDSLVNEGLTEESHAGVNIYVRRICHAQGTCTQKSNAPDWMLVQSLLEEVTITKLHVTPDGSQILAYDGQNNVLYVLRSNGCARNTTATYAVVQTVHLDANNAGDTYALCHSMSASLDHSVIAISATNLTKNFVAVYTLSNGAACEQTNGSYKPMRFTTNQGYAIVQTILDNRIRPQNVIVSRDGTTMVLEYGTGIAQNFVELENRCTGFLGMWIYHWQPDAAAVIAGSCQFVRRQTIEYDAAPDIYNGEQYTECVVPHTQHLFFSGANDDRIIRIAVRGHMDQELPLYPTLAGATTDEFISCTTATNAETEILHVFDRSAIKIDLCGNAVESCTDGIVDIGATTVTRGEFAEFVSKPYVELYGNRSFQSLPGCLYTHPVNKHVFCLHDVFTHDLHLFVESEVDNEWIMEAMSRFSTLDWGSTTNPSSSQGWVAYMTLLEDEGCEEQKTVCMPFARSYDGRFAFRTQRCGPGRYDGSGDSVLLSNTTGLPGPGPDYYTPRDAFIISQDGQDNPFMAGFPISTNSVNPNLDFTGAENPNVPGVPIFPDLPYPLLFNVWQKWPANTPGFPTCREGYFKMSAINPFVNIACNTVAEFVLTPKYYDFDPTSNEPEPNPNSNPELVFARTSAPVYVMLNMVCFSLDCHERDCRYLQSQFPSNFVAKPIAPYECAKAPFQALPVVSEEFVYLSWTDNSDNETGFKVERAPTLAGDLIFTEIASLPPNQTTYEDVPGLGGFCYRIASCAPGGLKSYSNVECVKAPTFIAALPNGQDITLTWTNNPGGATAFKVMRATFTGAPLFLADFAVIASLDVSVLTYTDTPAFGQYCYIIGACLPTEVDPAYSLFKCAATE